MAALKDQVAAGIEEPTADGPHRRPSSSPRSPSAPASSSPRQEAVVPRPAAAGAGRRRASRSCAGTSSTSTDRKRLAEIYEQRIFPVLTPLAVDPSHPFPYISNLALSIAAMVGDPDTGERRFARVKVPTVFPRLVERRRARASCPSSRSSSPSCTSLFVGHGHRGGGRVPGHPQRRPDARGRGGRRPARGGRDGAAPAPLRPRRAPRGRRTR